MKIFRHQKILSKSVLRLNLHTVSCEKFELKKILEAQEKSTSKVTSNDEYKRTEIAEETSDPLNSALPMSDPENSKPVTARAQWAIEESTTSSDDNGRDRVPSRMPTQNSSKRADTRLELTKTDHGLTTNAYGITEPKQLLRLLDQLRTKNVKFPAVVKSVTINQYRIRDEKYIGMHMLVDRVAVKEKFNNFIGPRGAKLLSLQKELVPGFKMDTNRFIKLDPASSELFIAVKYVCPTGLALHKIAKMTELIGRVLVCEVYEADGLRQLIVDVSKADAVKANVYLPMEELNVEFSRIIRAFVKRTFKV